MMRLMALLLPCREAAAAAARGPDSLPWWRRPLLAAHLAGCRYCTLFSRQMELIRRTFRQEFGRPRAGDTRALQDRILRRLGKDS